MTQWVISERLLNLDGHYTSENRGRVPNIIQQVFADISNTSYIDLQKEITDSGRPATEGGNVFQCTQCGKVYMSKGNLTRHLKFECGKEPQFQCPHCPLRTKHKSSLLTHIYCKHRGC